MVHVALAGEAPEERDAALDHLALVRGDLLAVGAVARIAAGVGVHGGEHVDVVALAISNTAPTPQSKTLTRPLTNYLL